MSKNPLTDREDAAIARLFDTAAEVAESTDVRMPSDLRRELIAALDEMQAARKAANSNPTH